MGMSEHGTGRLAGKACVVTGAAFGIGRATAVLFANEGAELVLTDIQAGPLTAELTGEGAWSAPWPGMSRSMPMRGA